MAYDREKIYKQAINSIKEHNLFFISDIVALLPIHIDTFYEFFPVNSEKSEHLKALLEENKVKEKLELRKGFKKGSSTEKLALYKLIATKEERKRLSMNNVDVTSDEKPIVPQKTVIEFVNSKKDK